MKRPSVAFDTNEDGHYRKGREWHGKPALNPWGKQRVKTVEVCNISNHEVINTIHPKVCIGMLERCLVLINIFRRKIRYAEERREMPQNSFIPVAEKRNYFPFRRSVQ